MDPHRAGMDPHDGVVGVHNGMIGVHHRVMGVHHRVMDPHRAVMDPSGGMMDPHGAMMERDPEPKSARRVSAFVSDRPLEVWRVQHYQVDRSTTRARDAGAPTYPPFRG
jgi:hypothetical protein